MSEIRWVKETTFKTTDDPPVPNWSTNWVMECQRKRCNGTVRADCAEGFNENAGVLRWTGVPCSECDATYTVEYGPEQCEHENYIDVSEMGTGKRYRCMCCGHEWHEPEP